MKKLTRGNITLMSDIEDYDLNHLQDLIDTAINFLCINIGVQMSDFNFNVIVTNNYNTQASNYIVGFTSSTTPNASTISKYQITNSNQEKKDVIIMNQEACIGLNDVSFTSILVHELVHHLDFDLIDSINKKFSVNINFGLEVRNKLEEQLTFLLKARSELRAFYYDEKYLLLNNQYTPNIDQVKKIEDDSYNLGWVLPRLMGKLKCWEEMNFFPTLILEAKSYINTASPYGLQWGSIIRNCFDYNSFYTKCVEIQLSLKIPN